MKRWFRPLAYSIIAVLAAVAVFGGKAPADASIVEPASAHRDARPSRRATGTVAPSPLTTVRARRPGLPTDLFVVDRPAPPPTTAPEIVAPVTAPTPEIKVLGWMQSESGPFVFVQWNNESYTLKPTESVDAAYRFDRVEAGFADFTYLPTGESRRYTVRDPALFD
jgi:hypothetical protein